MSVSTKSRLLTALTEGDGTTKRVPFNKAMLELIEDYLASGRGGLEVVALVRIMRATGGTVGEIGGLASGDVILNHATPHLLIRPKQLRRLKTAARTRPVPLVDRMALEAATMAVESRAGESAFNLAAKWWQKPFRPANSHRLFATGS